jgi:predicted dehydrogenase
MAHLHAAGYEARTDCEIVALCDIRPENAEAFAQQHAPDAAIYTDYAKMLKAEKPDLVSICLWPHLHAAAIIACAKAGVRAIHCEKPMAPTWGEAVKLAAACEKSGTQLTFNHQRRFLPAFQKAKELADSGTIGTLVRLEGACDNMIDWGTHWIDMMFFFNNETPAVWVLGQIDARQWHEVFGLPYEHQAICEFKFANDVRAVLFTGEDSSIGCQMRLIGADGVIELREGDKPVWVRAKGSGTWKTPKIEGGLHALQAVADAIGNMIDSLKAGTEPLLSARKALQTTEVIYATYESSRRRGRVDLPLKAKDSAYLSMIESGDLKPVKVKKG